MTDNERNFILELTKLTQKYGLCIWGCGCCGSPSLEEVEPNPLSGYIYEDELRWIEAEDSYDYPKHKDSIVRDEDGKE